jgi:two-component system, OmpR family, sensor histidine kinase KdpD
VSHRTWWGGAATVATLVAFTAALVPLRPHVDVATDAVLLVVPVLVGVAVGGLLPGVLGAVGGFFAYDWFFVPPFDTLRVGHTQDWAALAVYFAIVLVVTGIVEVEQRSRARAIDQERAVRRFLALNEALISARPLHDLLQSVVETVHELCKTRWVALLLPEHGALTVAAVAGGPLSDEDRERILTGSGTPQSLTLAGVDHGLSRVALSSSVGPVGQLVVADGRLAPFERELLGIFASQAALAIERHQLREHAVRVAALETADRWRSALMGAVSHDLRTPLTSMKLAVSTLRDAGERLNAADRDELLAMIEGQSDHLARLVTNVLDMARLEAGGLVLHQAPHDVAELVDAARRSLGTALHGFVIDVQIDDACPLVDVDVVLITQVLSNLLSNAAQHAPVGSTISVGAGGTSGRVSVWVDDEGPGVAPGDREQLFHMIDRRAGSGRAGLGLAIATAFVGAHDGTLTVSDAPTGGARFVFTLPGATDHREPQ